MSNADADDSSAEWVLTPNNRVVRPMASAAQTTRSRGRWFVGLPFLALAISLMVAYFRLPRMTASWSVTEHILFRSVVVFFGMIGLAQIAAAISTTRGAFATPGIGRHRMLVSTEGIVYLAIMFVLFTGAMLTRQNTLLLVFAIMAGPFVMNGWLTFGMLQAAKITRVAPRRAMVGELFGIELALANRHPLLSMWMMSVRDEIAHAHERLTAEVLFSRVATRAVQAGHYQLRLTRRGRYKLGPLQIFTRFPLGLVERSRLFPQPQEVLVYPRIGRLNPQWKRRWVGATELVARPQPNAGIFHDEFHRLREFRIGDNPRDIHWRSSARRGELILREYQQNRDFNLAVILELWQPPAARGKRAENELIERVLSLVLTLLVEHGRECRDGTLTLAATGATTFRWAGQGTSASLESLFDGLAVFEAGDARETTTLLDEALHQSTASTQIVLLTTRPVDDPSGLLAAARNPRVQVARVASLSDLESILNLESASASVNESDFTANDSDRAKSNRGLAPLGTEA